MEELSYTAKLSALRILTDIMNADKIVHEKEKEYLNSIIDSFNLSEPFKKDLDDLSSIQALITVKELTPSQKELISSMMGNMIIVDKDINYNEVKLYNTVCKACDIEKEFSINDYPDLSLSGEFELNG